MSREPKKDYFKTTGKIGSKIKLLFPDFNEKDLLLPAVFCCVCRHKILRAIADEKLKRSLQIPDYSKYHFKIKTRATKSEKNCECTLCDEIRSRQEILIQLTGEKIS